MALGAVLLLLAAAAPSPIPAGMYETSQMEVAAGLELKADGHFRYGLSYGAVDEEGEGDWTSDDANVWLTSRPMPTRPAFDLVRDDPAPKGELYMTSRGSRLRMGPWARGYRDGRLKERVRGLSRRFGPRGLGRQAGSGRDRPRNACVRSHRADLPAVAGSRTSTHFPFSPQRLREGPLRPRAVEAPGW